MKKKIGVKEIAQFLYSGGDLTNEFFVNKSNIEGHNAHVYLQNKYNQDSLSEVFVKTTVEKGEYELIINGFIDGVLKENNKTVLEEIKSTKLALDEISLEYHLEYLAQLKLYGYLYCLMNNLLSIDLRLTYIELVEYKTKSFDLTLDIGVLEKFFFDSVDKYFDWILLLEEAATNKLKTIAQIKFPFPNMRSGQRDLMKACFYTMSHNEILYAVAPTGIGKTMATLFSSLKTLKNPEDKLFYLTAKGMGKSVAVESVRKLSEQGLKMKTLVLTSKSKSCLNDKKNCDPEKCPYAKGFFDRLRAATEEIFQEHYLFELPVIEKYALKYTICSFEFALHLSYFCDLVIADYNYVFDPKAHLIRYFDDDTYQPKILVDEAHNLITRSKDMYSSSINTEVLKSLRKNLNGIKPSVRSDISKVISIIEEYEEKLMPGLVFYNAFMDDNLYTNLKRICTKCEIVFSDNKEFKNRDEALENYFSVRDFVIIAEYYSEAHRFIVKKVQDTFTVTIQCMDASTFIIDRIKKRCFGVVFFSATMFPIEYHMDLLTQKEGKYLVLPSPFEPDHLKLIVADHVSTKYRDREKSIDDIAAIIETLAKSKKGNYIVFFPSYQYIDLLKDYLVDMDFDLIIQKPNMSDNEREDTFNLFQNSTRTQVALFVMGGVFSEGMDYIGDLLSGVIIVGVGLPMVNIENNILKEYFDNKYENGFDYAYTYPGFNKVVQAAGRVIRTENDRGVVILIDERFRYRLYQNLMPQEWNHRVRITTESGIEKELNRFWRLENEKN